MATRFPKHVPHKLHLVTLVGSGIRRPYWEKRILKKLGLTKRLTSVVLKNTPEVNEDLRTIKTLIDVKPIVVVDGEKDEPLSLEEPELSKLKMDLSSVSSEIGELKLMSGPFLNVNGQFDIVKYRNYLDSFPKEELDGVLAQSHLLGSELLNRDYKRDEEAAITEKGEQIDLYFMKKTWHYPRRLQTRLKNRTKY